MNGIAKALFVIGWVCIISGLILGIANFGAERYVIDKEWLELFGEEKGEYKKVTSWSSLFYYWIAGAISGITMFGFGAIVNLLQQQKDLKEEQNTFLRDINYNLVLLKDRMKEKGE